MNSAMQSEDSRINLVKHFLQTAVVIDDEAFMTSSSEDKIKVSDPDRSGVKSIENDKHVTLTRKFHSLDARLIIESFTSLGIICSVVKPTESALHTSRQADIIILDWLLKSDSYHYTLELLMDLLATKTDRNSLRLIAVYTGESNLSDISKNIYDKLKEADLNPVLDQNHIDISYQCGRIVLYAKSGAIISDQFSDRQLKEELIPQLLIEDFASMTTGLLPGIVLASLAAVRDGEHRILNAFSADLDSAFLTQKSCISNPNDAEQQIVNQIAEELRGLMDESVANTMPVDQHAIKDCLAKRMVSDKRFIFKKTELNIDKTVSLVIQGLNSQLTDKHFEFLTKGFSGKDGVELDKRLAWLMSFRTVYNAPPPTLWLGSVIVGLSDGDERYLFCIQPRCDCVRLVGNNQFFFLPLVEPKKEMEQIVVRLDNNYKLFGIEFDFAKGISLTFEPSMEHKAVLAKELSNDGSFEYKDENDNVYKWLGELKAECAQAIVHRLANKLSRIATDGSEWLRRISK